MSSPASEILLNTAIAAVNSNSNIRVYTQDVWGSIRESAYDAKAGWTGGTARDIIAEAKIGSPIAATSTEGLEHIHVYYISTDDKLREMAYDASAHGWYTGDMNSKDFIVASDSKLAASFLPGDKLVVRVYAQLPDGTIQEFGDINGWKKLAQLGKALPGSTVDSTSFKSPQNSHDNLRVYFQTPNMSLVEKMYDGEVWKTGNFTISKAPPHAALAVTSWVDTGIHVRVYYAETGDLLLEKTDDGSGWRDGAFKQKSIPGSRVAAINFGSGSGLNLRVYFQNGTLATGVSEWVYGHQWSAGVPAIPPA